MSESEIEREEMKDAVSCNRGKLIKSSGSGVYITLTLISCVVWSETVYNVDQHNVAETSE